MPIWLLLLSLFLFSCGENEKITPPDIQLSPLEFGTSSTLDIVTWNLRNFPLSDETIPLLQDIIPRMKVEVIALQEISSEYYLRELVDALPDYDAVIYDPSLWQYTYDLNLAYIYNKNTITVNDVYSIFTNSGRAFPRPPFVMNLSFEGQDYILINNHFKAFGDDFIDESDPWDEEMRRLEASRLLEEYIRFNLPGQRVVLMGDLNDQVHEPPEYNVFMPFLEREDEYYFATLPIALNPSYDTVSYPPYLSVIDHLMITDELFEAYEEASRVCKAILVESVLGGYSRYNALISDHRPMGIRLKTEW